MFVSGFTFIRNGIKYDYPFREAILSVLPLVDEFIVAVGKSDDKTLEAVKELNSNKIRIIETLWDDSLREGGQVLALETDKAYKEINAKADWCFYIQGDEVLHEKFHQPILNAMEQHCHNEKVEGLLFDYQHFYGSYDYIGDSYSWYRKEIRIVRKNQDIYSYRDAQGFRKKNAEKLKVKQIPAQIYHYGWVKDPRAMQKKQESFHKLWHDDQWLDDNIPKADEFDYSQISSLQKFQGSHPKVMEERVQQSNWKFDFDLSGNYYKPKEKLIRFIEKLTGLRIGEYRNYIKLK